MNFGNTSSSKFALSKDLQDKLNTFIDPVVENNSASDNESFESVDVDEDVEIIEIQFEFRNKKLI